MSTYKCKDYDRMNVNLLSVETLDTIRLQPLKGDCNKVIVNNTTLNVPPIRTYMGFMDLVTITRGETNLEYTHVKRVHTTKLKDILEYSYNEGNYKVYRVTLKHDVNTLSKHFRCSYDLSIPNTIKYFGDEPYICLSNAIPDLDITYVTLDSETSVHKLDINLIKDGINTIIAKGLIECELKFPSYKMFDGFTQTDVDEVTSGVRK